MALTLNGIAQGHATDRATALLAGAEEVGHILDPARALRPALWSTATIVARNAALADGLSTAMTFMDRSAIRDLLAAEPDLVSVLLVDRGGAVTRLG